MELDADGGALNKQKLAPAMEGDTASSTAGSIASLSPAGVIDLLAHDTKTDEVLLAIFEPRPWDGSDLRLYELQEKFNAYVSFLLDGEMAEAHPDFIGKPARIELRCAGMPDPHTLGFLEMVRDQMAFQEIKLEVVVEAAEGCGPGCACSG